MEHNLLNNYRYRLTYSRDEMMAWLAHLDLMRNFQYSFRRADLPIAYSKGYNPRPIMEFGLPVGVGIETRSDPIEVELTEEIATESIKKRLNLKLPPGIRIESSEQIIYPSKSLMSLVEAADYTIKANGVGPATERIFLSSSEEILVQRERKGKIKEYDLRHLVLDIKIINNNVVKLQCRAGSSANLRPDMFLKALYESGEISKISAFDAIIVRNKVYLNVGEKIVSH